LPDNVAAALPDCDLGAGTTLPADLSADCTGYSGCEAVLRNYASATVQNLRIYEEYTPSFIIFDIFGLASVYCLVIEWQGAKAEATLNKAGKQIRIEIARIVGHFFDRPSIAKDLRLISLQPLLCSGAGALTSRRLGNYGTRIPLAEPASHNPVQRGASREISGDVCSWMDFAIVFTYKSRNAIDPVFSTRRAEGAGASRPGRSIPRTLANRLTARMATGHAYP
jgi:hypothetical protein